MADEPESMEGRLSITLYGTGRFAGECRLTPLATAMRAGTNRIDWLIAKVTALGLEPAEFTFTIGVKVKRGYGVRVATHLLPPREQQKVSNFLAGGTSTDIETVDKMRWDIVAYELLTEWHAGDTRPTVAIPVAWPASVLENHGQDEAAFRTKMRWLFTELMLARYGLDSYRESKLER